MGDVNLEIKLSNLDERVIKIEDSGGGSGGDSYITSVSNDFNVVNKKLSLSNGVTTKLGEVDNKANSSDVYNKTEVDNKLDSWFSQTQQATATGEQSVVFTGLDTTKAYELWFETTNGSQVSVKSSSLSGTTMTYVVDIPTDCPVPVNFKLRVIK